MLQQVLEFAGNHWLLVSALIVVTVALIVTEARHLRSGTRSLDPAAATQLYNKQDAVFVDVRPEADYRKAHLPGAINAPANAFAERLPKLDKYKARPVVVYCGNGLQSARFAAQLGKAGFGQAYELKGGLAAWQSAGFPLESR